MSLQGKRVAILIESDFYEPEIHYYQHRFREEGIELHFLTRLWGQDSIPFRGHEYHVPFDDIEETFENITDEQLREYAAIIVPSGIVADRLRYTEDIRKLPPATEFLKRAFRETSIIKGIICHGMWLVAPAPELVRGRRVVVHNNLLGDVKNMGAIYVDEDVVVDGEDLVTARTGGHCHLFARAIIEMLKGSEGRNEKAEAGRGTTHPLGRPTPLPGETPEPLFASSRGTWHAAPGAAFSHVALNCRDPRVIESFYTRHFGFRRARVIPVGSEEIVFLRCGEVCLELFKASGTSPLPAPEKDGPAWPGCRHLAFQVEDVDATLARMGEDARVTLGPLSFDEVIPGWRTAWIADPEGNIVEISQGYCDQIDPPALREKLPAALTA